MRMDRCLSFSIAFELALYMFVVDLLKSLILGAPLQEQVCFSILTLNDFAESFGDEVESELQG